MECVVQVEKLFTLNVYSHFFRVNDIHPRVLGLIMKFATFYVTYGFSHAKTMEERAAKHFYFSKVPDDSEYRFHIGQLAHFLDMLEKNYIEQYMFETVHHDIKEPIKINTQLKPHIELRDYQVAARDFIVETDSTDHHTRLIGLRTGSGKGIVSMAGITKLGYRTGVVVLPTYIEKWCDELIKETTVKPKQLMTIQGGDQLKSVIQMAKDGVLISEFIIFSLITLRMYHTAYEKNPPLCIEEYGCHPEELFPLLGIGTLTFDETHQHLNAVFKTLLYSHVKKVIALTATLISEDHTVARIHKLMFPKEARFENTVHDRYIKVRSFSYSFNDIKGDKVKWQTWGSNAYSHVEFEKSIMRKPHLIQNYFRMIDSIINNGYLMEYQPGDKLIVFAATIEMCTKLTEHLKIKHPKLDVRRYVEDDKFENVIDPDIRVTTILSGGTAIDIPNLRCAVMTTSIQSPVSNLQAIGRLRKLKDRDVKFCYPYCEQIPKHVQYHRSKMALFETRVESHKDYRYNMTL